MKYLSRMRATDFQIKKKKKKSLLQKISLKRILEKIIFSKKVIQMEKSEIPGGLNI